jgi:hypothetical protein
VHNFSLPHWTDILRRALFISSLRIKWTCPQIEEANSDFRQPVLADDVSISFLFTRFFCEHIFQTDIPRERPAPPEQLLDFTALSKMEFTKSPHISPGMAPPLLFAVFLSGVDDLDSADPTLSIFREVYRQVPINAEAA